jgi:hypothetical protein
METPTIYNVQMPIEEYQKWINNSARYDKLYKEPLINRINKAIYEIENEINKIHENIRIVDLKINNLKRIFNGHGED